MKLNRGNLFLLIFVVILLAGIGIRIFYIYEMPPSMPEDDSSTIGLMTLDILKGRIPLFFSGQDYTGSVEPLWLSVFVALFGLSTATLYLGMISLFVIFSLTMYWMGKILGGKFVGLFTIIYLSIPPYLLLHESVAPYGYHMALLIFGNLILISSLLLAEEGGRKKDFIWWAVLGFSIGMGIWVHFSIIYYIIPAGVFLLFNKRIIDLVKNSFIVIVFIIIGGLPFWIYNLITNFSSFDFYDGRPYTLHNIHMTYLESFNRVINYHLTRVIGTRDTAPIIQKIGWIVFCALFLLFVLSPNGKRLIKSKKMLFVFLFITIIIIFSHQKYFSRSPYSYYLLPMYSVIPILVGYLADWLNKKIKYSGTAFISIILIFNICGISKEIPQDRGIFGDRYRNWMEHIQFLYSKRINNFYAHFTVCQPINYLTKNKILGAELFDGRAPTDVELQARDTVAIHGLGELDPAIKMLCKEFKIGYAFKYGFRQFGYYGRDINSSKFYGTSNYNSKDARYTYDRNLDIRWFVSKERKTHAYYQLDLGGVHKIYRIILFPYTWDFPFSFRIKVSTDGINWRTILRTTNPHPLFWSGPRLYWDFRYGRHEIIFKPAKARYIRLEENGGGIDWGINEIFVFKYLGEKDYKLRDYVKPARQVYRYLIKKKIKFAYADFWLSAKIGKWSNNKIGSLQVENICYPLRKNTSRVMKIDSDTSIIINSEMQEETEKVLKEFNLPIEKKIISDYICYLFTQSGEKPLGFKWQNYFLKYQDSLYWAGVMPVKKSFKSYSQVLYGYGLKLEREGDLENAISYYKKALEVYPRNYLARQSLVNYYKKNRPEIEYKKELLKLKHLSPNVKKIIEFKNGATFLGYRAFRHNNRLRIDYYWKASRKLTDYTVAFVYFIKDKKIVFQGDYPLPFEYPNPVIRLKDWTFVERSRVLIPHGIESGRYEILIGLYLPNKGGKRIRAKDSETKITIGEFKL